MDHVPRIHVRRGRQVQPDGPRTWKTLRADRDDIVAHANQLFQKHKHLYIVDVDGHRHGEASLSLYQRLERRGVPIWLEAGFRKLEDVMDGFFAGAERVTIRLQDMPPAQMREVVEVAAAPVYLGIHTDPHGIAGGWRTDQIVGFLEETRADGLVIDDTAAIGPTALRPVMEATAAAGTKVAYASARAPPNPDPALRFLVVDAP